jgi:ribonuclease Z
MQNTLSGYSKALYATWFYYKPARLLLDAGEGIVQALGKKIFGIRKVFLTHGHEDHIAGLPSLVNLRNLSNGDREIPIEVVHPEGDPFIGYLREYLSKKQKHRLRYDLEWRAVGPGAAVDVDIARRPTRMVSFAVDHTRGWQSLGWRLEEKRQAPRAEFAGAGSDEIRRLVMDKGKGEVLETVWHPLLVYTGDCMPPRDLEPLKGADLLLMDSTYLSREEMAGMRHGHIDGSLKAAAEAGAKHLVLMHLSGRYLKREIREAVAAAVDRHGRPPRLGYFFESRYHEIEERD